MDRATVMSWLEGLAQSDWREFHSDSEVQNIASEALSLLKKDCHNCKLECLLQKYDELKEKHDALLKEHEAKQPSIMQDQEGIWSICSKCGYKLRPFLAMELDMYFPKFCSECGQKVKW